MDSLAGAREAAGIDDGNELRKSSRSNMTFALAICFSTGIQYTN